MNTVCKTVLAALLVAAVAAGTAEAFRLMPPRSTQPSVPGSGSARPASKPRLLTNGMAPELARSLSRVEPMGGVNESYSGYASVGADPTCGSELFYWFFPSMDGNASAPVVLWLQGGPGGSSMFGLFGENGPFSVSDSLELVPRNTTWARHASMLYIDNPVGVGWSVTNTSRPECLARDQQTVANDLYEGLQEFYRVHPQQRDNEFYVFAESYGGKYAPALGNRILEGNAAGTQPRIPLAGVGVGDGLTDPVTQVTGYGNLAYSFGVADLRQRDAFVGNQTLAVELIRRKDWAGCVRVFETLVDGPPDYFSTISGSHNYYDLRTVFSKPYGGPWAAYLNQTAVRERLHVGDNYFDEDGDAAGNALNNDICKSELPHLVALLEAKGVRVLLYNGQFDFIVAPVTTEIMLQSTPWNGLKAYQEAPRGIWRLTEDDPDVAGYVRHTDSLTQIILRGAGHISPGDQPERCFDMVNRFLNREPFF